MFFGVLCLFIGVGWWFTGNLLTCIFHMCEGSWCINSYSRGCTSSRWTLQTSRAMETLHVQQEMHRLKLWIAMVVLGGKGGCIYRYLWYSLYCLFNLTRK